MSTMKRARVELEPITIEHAARLRRLRALQRLQLFTLDQEHRHTSILQRVAQEAVECQARATADKAAASGGAATTVAAAAVAEASAFARAVQREAREAAASSAHHNLKVRVLTNRHETEQAKVVFQAGSELKGLKALIESSTGEAAAGVGGGDGGVDGDETAGAAAAAAAAAPVSKPSAAVLAAAAAASSASAVAPVAGGGTAVCSYCGWRLDKSKQIECYECHRAFCGLGGRGIHSPHGAPCIDIYQCSCKLRRLCHECYDGAVGRSAESGRAWARCGACEAWLCPRELSGTFSGCCRFSGCGTGPLCRACRVAHEKECGEKGKRERVADRGGDGYSDEDDDFE